MKDKMKNGDEVNFQHSFVGKREGASRDDGISYHTLEERKFEYSGGEVSRQSSVAEFTIRRSSMRACVEGREAGR